MARPFERTLYVGWTDLDANNHMRNTAYLDKAVDVRMMYFAAKGFPMAEFERQRIGPVVFQDTADYFREMRLLDPIRVTFCLAGLSDDASRFILRNEFFDAAGKMVARLNSLGGWLDLAARRLTAPPARLADALRALERSDNFRDLASTVKP